MSRFGERFRDGQYNLVSFLFAVFLLTVPSAHPFESEERAPSVPYGVGATVYANKSYPIGLDIDHQILWTPYPQFKIFENSLLKMICCLKRFSN